MNRRTLSACAAAFSLMMAGALTAQAQESFPATEPPAVAPEAAVTPTAGVAPRSAGQNVMDPALAPASDNVTAPDPGTPPAPPVPRAAPMYTAYNLPLVYAPGPGYGSFTRAPKQMICYSASPAQGSQGGLLGGLSGPASYAAVGLTAFVVATILF